MSRPLVSVLVLAHNGEPYLERALETLLGQEHEQIEVLISDNASTDATGSICRAYAEKDERIRYARNDENIGVVASANKLLERITGEYFMFAADHDVWHPAMISRCLESLAGREELVLAYPRTTLIDPAGDPLLDATDDLDTTGLPALQRYLRLLENMRWFTAMYGLIRSSTARRIGPFRVDWGPDMIYLAQLALRGEFAEVPEELFSMRMLHPEHLHDVDAWHERQVHNIHPSAYVRGGGTPPRPQLYRGVMFALLRVLSASDLPLAQRAVAVERTVRCFENRYGVRTPYWFVRRSRKAPAALVRRLRRQFA